MRRYRLRGLIRLPGVIASSRSKDRISKNSTLRSYLRTVIVSRVWGTTVCA